jgi:hypothetical protein
MNSLSFYEIFRIDFDENLLLISVFLFNTKINLLLRLKGVKRVSHDCFLLYADWNKLSESGNFFFSLNNKYYSNFK